MKVAVLGWYGHGNFGDDQVILRGLQNLFKDWEVVVMSSDDKGTYPMIDINRVNECDLFVLGGGELIGPNYLFMFPPVKIPRQVQRLYARSSLSHRPWFHKITIPKVILGCGVNIERPDELRSNVVKDLEQFDYIGLRDNKSVEILRLIPQLEDKVHLFHDLGFSINIEGIGHSHYSDRAVVIPTDRFTFSDRGVQECNVAMKSWRWLKERLEPYKKHIYLAFGGEDNNDLQTCRTLSLSCSNDGQIVNCSRLSLERIVEIIGDSSLTFPYRLHGLILSFLTGTKYEFYPYHRKLQRVHDTITGLDPKEIQRKQKASFNEITNRMINRPIADV